MDDLDDKVLYQAGDNSSAQTPSYDVEDIAELMYDITSGKGKGFLKEQYWDIQGVDQLTGNQSTIVGRIKNKKAVLQQLGFEETKDGSYRELTHQDFLIDVVNKVSAGKIKRKYSTVFPAAKLVDRNRTEQDVEDNLGQILQYSSGYEKSSIDDFHKDVGRGVGLNTLKERYQNCEFADLLDLLSPQQSAVDYRANQEKIIRYNNAESTDKESTLHEVIADIYAGASNKTLTQKHGDTFDKLGSIQRNWSWESRAQNAQTILGHYMEDVQNDEELENLRTLFEANLTKLDTKRKNITNSSNVFDDIGYALCMIEDELPEQIEYDLTLKPFAKPTIMGDDEGLLTDPSTEWETDGEDHLFDADDAAINYRKEGTVRDEGGFAVLVTTDRDDWLEVEIDLDGSEKLVWDQPGRRSNVSTLMGEVSYLYVDTMDAERDLPFDFERRDYRRKDMTSGKIDDKRFVSTITISPKSIVPRVPQNVHHIDWIDYADLGEYKLDLSGEIDADYNLLVIDDDWLGDLSLDPDGWEDQDPEGDIKTDFDLPLLDSLVSVQDTEVSELDRSLPLSSVFSPRVNSRTYGADSTRLETDFYSAPDQDAVVPLGAEMAELVAKGLRASPVIDDAPVWRFEEEPEPVYIDLTGIEERGTHRVASSRGVFVDTEPVGVHRREDLIEARDSPAGDTQNLLNLIVDKRPIPPSVRTSKKPTIDLHQPDGTETWEFREEPGAFDSTQRVTTPTPRALGLEYELVEEEWFKDGPDAEDWTDMEPKKKSRRKKKSKKKKVVQLVQLVLKSQQHF